MDNKKIPRKIMLDTNASPLEVCPDLLRVILDNSGAYFYVMNTNRRYIYANRATRELFGLHQKSALGFTDTDVRRPDNLKEWEENDRRVLENGETVEGVEKVEITAAKGGRDIFFVKKPIYNRKGVIIGLLGIGTDITRKMKREDELWVQATTDPLTGLANRRFFQNIAAQEFAKSKRHTFPFSLILMDIDFFKNINDSWGHPVGDAVINLTGAQIGVEIRPEDLLARVGGEEFALLLPNTNLVESLNLAERIRTAVASLVIVGEWDGEIKPTISLGVTALLRDDQNFDQMYHRADRGLYKAKNSGRNIVCEG